ncbi:MAG: hypothetical protein EOM19_01125 [Candidatus Moranbacteria bacterium]|nr:hypothetical protein [Candidatus Moranbacteria bacterium]
MRENNQPILILYKLSSEFFVFTLFISFFYYSAEIVLPGIFSQRVSLFPLFLAMTGSALLFVFIGQFVEKKKEVLSLEMSKKQGIFFSVLFSLFVLSQPGKIGWEMYIFLFILVFISFYGFLLLIFSKEKENV